MNKVGVAIIGAGLIGKKRAAALLKIPVAVLVSIYDINKEAASAFSREYKCSIARNIDEILNNQKINLVIIAIRHKDAAAISPKILEKKNLLLEKPLGRNLIEAKNIIRSAQKYKHMLSVGYSFRYYPHIRMAIQYIKERKLGRIISSTFTIGHAAQPGYEKTWKLDKDLCGGGVILDPGIHMIDLMIRLIGKPQKQHVYVNQLGWNSQVEDETFITFEYKNKSISLHHYSLNMSKNTFFIEIIGKKGVIRLHGRAGNYGDMQFTYTPKWFWLNKQKPVEKNFGHEDDSFYEELKDLVIKLNKNHETNNYSEYLDCMKILNSLYKEK